MQDADSSYTLSVALVTRNRLDSLRRTLVSLCAQSVQPYEVVVSDDSDDSHAEEIRAIVKEFGFRYLRGPRRGLYANRNHVVRMCSGTHVRSMDDDHEFPPGHFEQCMSAIRSDPRSVWIIGEFLPQHLGANSTPGCPGEWQAAGYSAMPSDPQNCAAISDGASLYPMGIFSRGLRFSEDYKFGAAYLEFGWLLKHLGYRIRFLKTTHIIHHYDEGARSWMSEEINSGAAVYASFCLCRVYRPSWRNKAGTFKLLIRTLMRHGHRAPKIICTAWANSGVRIATVSKWKLGA